MSIQINGIDKPKSCFDCPCIDAEFEECAAREHYLLPKDEYGAVLGDVPDWCPITELQTCDDAVSRQQAIDAFKKELTTGEPKGNYITICSAVSFEGAKQILEALPAVQPQPEIIRCKDCKYWMRENISDGYCSEMNIGGCDEDFYCGYAEALTMEEFMDGQDMGNPEDGSL